MSWARSKRVVASCEGVGQGTLEGALVSAVSLDAGVMISSKTVNIRSTMVLFQDACQWISTRFR